MPAAVQDQRVIFLVTARVDGIAVVWAAVRSARLDTKLAISWLVMELISHVLKNALHTEVKSDARR
jgi:hypothetical protein